jgi:hypothetical protein
MGVWFVILWSLFFPRKEEERTVEPATDDPPFPWREVFKALWDIKWNLLGIAALVGGLFALHWLRDAWGIPEWHLSLQSDLSIMGVILLCFWIYFSWTMADAQARIKSLERDVERLQSESRTNSPVYHPTPTVTPSPHFIQQLEEKSKAERLALERTERNREVKRRAKARKRAAYWERLFQEVKKSQAQERIWRDQVAREYGWPYHPNDMRWLNDVQRKDMLDTFGERGPFKDEWLKPDDYDEDEL